MSVDLDSFFEETGLTALNVWKHTTGKKWVATRNARTPLSPIFGEGDTPEAAVLDLMHKAAKDPSRPASAAPPPDPADDFVDLLG